jgi:hypothetical protein
MHFNSFYKLHHRKKTQPRSRMHLPTLNQTTRPKQSILWSLRFTWPSKKLLRKRKERDGGVSKVVEQLPIKHEALSSYIPQYHQKKRGNNNIGHIHTRHWHTQFYKTNTSVHKGTDRPKHNNSMWLQYPNLIARPSRQKKSTCNFRIKWYYRSSGVNRRLQIMPQGTHSSQKAMELNPKLIIF